MLDPNLAFSLTGPLVLAGWAGLILSLFVKQVRPIAWPTATIVIPVILAVAYVLLIRAGFGEAQGGGYGSIEEIRALFASDSALVAGWFHYLAFDLFIGGWIVREGLERGLPSLLILLCLPPTFLFGPAGLLLFFVLRSAQVVLRRQPRPEAV
ncbi:MAG TPA: ABA4-like family protein [Allosphingosinicella sp.]